MFFEKNQLKRRFIPIMVVVVMLGTVALLYIDKFELIYPITTTHAASNGLWFQTAGRVHSEGLLNNNNIENAIEAQVPDNEKLNKAPKAITSARGDIDVGNLGGIVGSPPLALTKYETNPKYDMNYSYEVFEKRITSFTSQGGSMTTPPIDSGVYKVTSALLIHDDSQPFIVPSGKYYVIFVDNKLQIAKNIQVRQGGFLAFIVKEDIEIRDAVTVVEGTYFTDQKICTKC